MERDLWDGSVGVFCWSHGRGRRLIFELEKVESAVSERGLWNAGSLMLVNEDEARSVLSKCLYSAGECIYILLSMFLYYSIQRLEISSTSVKVPQPTSRHSSSVLRASEDPDKEDIRRYSNGAVREVEWSFIGAIQRWVIVIWAVVSG